MSQSSRPARISSLKHYLAGAVGTTALLGASQTEAAVTAVTFGFGSVYDSSDPNNGTNWSVGNYGTIRGNVDSSSLYLGGQSNQGTVYHNSSVNSSRGTPTFFANGTLIGGGGNGNMGFAYFWSPSSDRDLTADQLNKNIGFKTINGNYGWANVSWAEGSKALTINSAYVESVVGASIHVGDVSAAPEPSRALLALAGLTGVAMRRRRKQVA